ncbi:type II and III secretion system protein family protein [Novosphingobium sp.]|uniref:type II and III secretion system protein family protein n=1 Tax=Novosphingobium sp. TaxID=1874826 RepID=UPI0022BB63BC|nr:type II and III secretion system protein family protein [Novosphingobium sp.]MCZ8020068.1 type II and III secretion system protein family protein [Novosphingobium sp.]MCZ8035713.1 type II and III secretion system protein family protein [Novosphingobium sp.]MCZ8053111.1 type II and III secretion system protein family protein [Novosphingobium sp.]MCZ8061108.1 type II and III secretion system protein family protein [Novosphingobium sp.]MCZ8230837.1 type II and III secretion system protein fami
MTINPIPANRDAMKGKPMKRLLSTLLGATCAVASLAIVTAAPAQAQSVSRPANDIALSIGRGQLITVNGTMADVFVANDSIADVQVKSQRQLYVFGKAGGTTTVYASNAAGEVIWSANIRVGSNIDSVDQMLRVAMPDAKIAVSTMGTNTVLLTGTIASPEDGAEATRLVEAFMGKETNVISRLRMATPLQVNLRVKFAEVSRSLVKTLGVNLTTIDSSGGFQFGIGQGRTGFAPSMYAGPGQALGVGSKVKIQLPDPTDPTKLITVDGSAINPATIGTTLAAQTKLFGMNLLGALDIGEQLGLVTSLSEPNLTALSGETADFLAGGEYPIPVSQGLGTTSVEYKKFGVSLAYTPTVLANGRISLRVRPEVSELSSQGSITLNGFQVPALTVRRAETTIELGSGQSFMIAGLMGNSAQNTVKKMPGAGDLPILGSLFRSTNFQRGETELVIVVTPYLVNPVDANDIKLPTDGFQNPDDIQRYFGNMENNGKTGGDRPKPSAAPNGAPAPKVGDLDLPPAAPQPADKRSPKKTRTAATTKDAAPGFSLN